MAISQLIVATGQRNVGVQGYSSTKTNAFAKMKYQVDTQLHSMWAKSQPTTESSTAESMSVFKIVTPQNLSHLRILDHHQNRAS